MGRATFPPYVHHDLIELALDVLPESGSTSFARCWRLWQHSENGSRPAFARWEARAGDTASPPRDGRLSALCGKMLSGVFPLTIVSPGINVPASSVLEVAGYLFQKQL